MSLIQSLYSSFGSGLVAPGTGVMLHNRGGLFTVEDGHPNQLAPRKRPLHTIIPAFMEKGDVKIGFGIMGGFNQAQAHAQFVSDIADFGLDVQQALEVGRFTKGSFTGCDVDVEALVPDATRTLPIFSVNTGLNFERKANIFGNSFLQTLEPVAYYVNIPYRNQSNLPNFESGLQDINFASIFSENQFSGHDRINDANQLTLGLRSRLINPDSGFEVIRAGIAQRYYFEGQRVTLPGVAPRSNSSVQIGRAHV